MKPTFKDYLSIALALLAIFLCGYGIGFLFGERKGQRSAPPPEPVPVVRSKSISDWEAATLRVIRERVELTPDQLAGVKAEISASAERIRAARQSFDREMRDINDRLRQHLTPEQWEKLQIHPPIEGESK